MQREKSFEGSDLTSLGLSSNSAVACVNRKKVTFTDGCSSCGSKKRRCQFEEEPRKKINLVRTTDSFSVKPTIVSPLKPFDNNFSFQWPPPFRQSESPCPPNSAEAVKTTAKNPIPPVLDLERKCSFSDSSFDILRSPLGFFKPPISSTISPNSNDTIKTVTKHTVFPSPSGETLDDIGHSAAKTVQTREDILHHEASQKAKCARVLWSEEDELEIEPACKNDCKTKTVAVVCKGGDQEGQKIVQFKCFCGRLCDFIFFH